MGRSCRLSRSPVLPIFQSFNRNIRFVRKVVHGIFFLKWRSACIVKIGNPRISGLAIWGPTFGINFCCLLTPGLKAVFSKCPIDSFYDIFLIVKTVCCHLKLKNQPLYLLQKSNVDSKPDFKYNYYCWNPTFEIHYEGGSELSWRYHSIQPSINHQISNIVRESFFVCFLFDKCALILAQDILSVNSFELNIFF